MGAADCVAFELYLGADAKACYIFRRAVEPPFTAEPTCLTCVRNKWTAAFLRFAIIVLHQTNSNLPSFVRLRSAAGWLLPA